MTVTKSSHTPQNIRNLARRESRYWYLLAAICIMTTLGLVVAISPLLQERISTLWPWANTSIVLLAGLAISMGLLVTYLTLQQGKARDMRRQLQAMSEESVLRERQNLARLRALLNVSRMMGSVTNLENVFNTIVCTCLEVFQCQQASLMLLNERTRELETRAVTGHANPDVVKNATQKIGTGIAGWVAQEQEPLILTRDTDLSLYPDLQLKDKSINAAMIVPILLRDEFIGVINISSRSPDVTYTDQDLQALRVFAENAGTCIRHAQHVEWMRKTLSDTLDHSWPGASTGQKKAEALTKE
ncbi:MAG: GAF domain-containing protein [Candidatus Krumholzibacteria bacterium]|nr:GAF domain-containing protein [Candidatus Krumholzibacteria bacterium]